MLAVDARSEASGPAQPRVYDALWLEIGDDLGQIADSIGYTVKVEDLYEPSNTPENQHIGKISTIELGRYSLRLAPTNLRDREKNPGFSLVDTETDEATPLKDSGIVLGNDSVTIVLASPRWSDEPVKGFYVGKIGGVKPFEAPKQVLTPDVLKARDIAYDRVVSRMTGYRPSRI